MTKRLLSVAAVAAFGVSLLSGCGGGDGNSASDYCAQVKDVAKSDADITDEAGLKLAKDVRDSAPDEIKDDWSTFVDFMGMAAGGADPSKIDPSKAQDVQKAITNIESYTKDKCGIDLNES